MAKVEQSHDEEFLPEGHDHPYTHVGRKDAPQFMPDDARMLAFTAIAALLDSGLSLSESVDLLTDEYRAKGSARAADMLRQYFDAVARAAAGEPGIDLKEAAGDAFGQNFVSLEEALVLSTLPRSARQAETLRAAAGLVSFKGSRPVSQLPPRGRR